MSIQFILDGYNILHQTGIDPAMGIDDQRKYLIGMIESKRPHGSWNNPLTIVFDGRPGPYWRDPVTSFKIMFSYDISADDTIRKLVENGGSAKTTVVITDDRELQSSVRAGGATVMAVHEFLSRMSKKHYPKAGRDLIVGEYGSGKHISKTVEYKINKEMQDIWLNKNKGSGQ
jgi:predicted RNA-binding protein with PIN domain